MYDYMIPAANPMCPAQASVSNKHSHQPAACLTRIINTVYACSPLASVDTNTCWTSTTPPIQTNRTAFPSQTLLLRPRLVFAHQTIYTLNGAVVKICSICGSKSSKDCWVNLIKLPQLPRPRSYKRTSSFPGQISYLRSQRISQIHTVLENVDIERLWPRLREKERRDTASKILWML